MLSHHGSELDTAGRQRCSVPIVPTTLVAEDSVDAFGRRGLHGVERGCAALAVERRIRRGDCEQIGDTGRSFGARRSA